MDEAALKEMLEALKGRPDVEQPASDAQRQVIGFLQRQPEFEGNLMLSLFGNGWMSAAMYRGWVFAVTGRALEAVQLITSRVSTSQPTRQRSGLHARSPRHFAGMGLRAI
jgi:hypothetical protein